MVHYVCLIRASIVAIALHAIPAIGQPTEAELPTRMRLNGEPYSQQLRQKLELVGIAYQVVSDQTGTWVVWSRSDAETVKAIEPLEYTGNTDTKLYVLQAAGRKERVAALLLEAAAAGEPVAQHLLGIDYMTGRSVPRDYAEAMRWLKAATANGSDASFQVGLLYEQGWGVGRDYAEALRFFRVAAENKDGVAMCKVALYYQGGFGVTANSDIAREYFAAAAAQKADCTMPGIAP